MGSKPWTLSLGLAQTKIASALKAYQRRVYLYQQKLQGSGGPMVEFSPGHVGDPGPIPANARTASF